MGKLVDLINKKAITFGEFDLANGDKSNYYIDLRKITLSSKGAQLIVSKMLKLLNRIDYDAIGGPTLGADPIIGSMLMYTEGKRGFIIRKAFKEHGTKKLIEGDLRKDDKVVIVEDVITSGKSALQACEIAESVGAKVVKVISVLDRLSGGEQLLKDKGYDFSSILTIDDINILHHEKHL